jgi:hypothetical protein
MAEKSAWGYEDVEPNLVEAYKLFRQAGDLGFSDALIRVGELQENGKGTARNPNAAVRSYIAAAQAGNFFGLAYLAKLLSRASHLEKAADIWSRFFAALAANPEPRFVARHPNLGCTEITKPWCSCGARPGVWRPGRTTLTRSGRHVISSGKKRVQSGAGCPH